MSENSSSTHETRRRLTSGSKTAVKNPISEKQITPMDTFEALMLP